MKLITPNMYIGTRVLFIWNSIPFTGTISSIGTDHYGIKCDSDIYTTDRLLIPRIHDEICVGKNKCLKTGEVSPIMYMNGCVNTGYNFPDVKTAFYHLPKQTIYPLISGKLNRFITFIPEKHVMKLTDGKFYLYTRLNTKMVSLINIHDKTSTRVPNWKFQGYMCYDGDEDTVNEFNIDMIYEIPENRIHYDAANLLESGMMNIIYDVNTNDNIRLTHFVRTRSDVDFNNLPDEIIYDFNMHTK